MAKEKITDMMKRIKEKKEIIKQLNAGYNYNTSSLPTVKKDPKVQLKLFRNKASQVKNRMDEGHMDDYENWWEHDPVPVSTFKKKRK